MTIDWVNSQFLSNEGMWRFFIKEPDLEILIAGSEEKPDQERIMIAKEVEKNLDNILNKAIRYLNAFVDINKLNSEGAWYPQALEFGRRSDDSVDEFVLLLTLDNDAYGFWYVKHKIFPSSSIEPIAFGREQK